MKYTCCQTLGPVPSPTGPHGPTQFVTNFMGKSHTGAILIVTNFMAKSQTWAIYLLPTSWLSPKQEQYYMRHVLIKRLPI